MQQKTKYIILILQSFLILNNISAQIVREPDKDLQIDTDKGILMITPCVDGSFYLNEYYLMDIKAGDTVFLNNVVSGNYYMVYQTDSLLFKRSLNIKPRQVLPIAPCQDTFNIYGEMTDKYTLISKMTGIKYYTPKRRYFYNVTQASFISLYFDAIEKPFLFFHSFTTINGYQAAPGFCIGLGVSYSFYPTERIFWLSSYDQVYMKNLQFLPIFMDIRMHLPPSSSGRTSPFFKFDLGYNLTLKNGPIWNDGYSQYTLKHGRIYFSPGFGFRIFVSELLQIIPSVEYSLEGFLYENTSHYESEYKKNLSFIKLNIGIAMQYK